MPARTISVLRSIVCVKGFCGNGPKRKVLRFVDVVEALPKSTCIYSTFTVQGPCTPTSTPPPAAQPVLVVEIDPDSVAPANVSVKLKLPFTLPTATPPVP